jgi:Uma2 family endonuclease
MTTEVELLTLEEYAALDEPDEAYVSELVRGVVVREPRPRRLHGEIQVRIAYHLQAWANQHGGMVTAESGYILSEAPATVRGPDVAIVLDPVRDESAPGGWVRGAPDVAVEILSPSDTSSATQQRTIEYLEAGARRVWIVDPAARTVTAFRPDGSANIVRGDGTLDGEDILDGFSVPLSEFFG